MTEFKAESYTDENGIVFVPGEEVIFAGSSYKNTRLMKGTFKGVRYDTVGRTEYLTDAEGNPIYEEKKDWRGNPFLVQKTERKYSKEIVSVVIENVFRGFKWEYRDNAEGESVYTQTDEKIFGTSTLSLKRVYKLNSPLADLVGTYF